MPFVIEMTCSVIQVSTVVVGLLQFTYVPKLSF